jgi:hypothetical protein
MVTPEVFECEFDCGFEGSYGECTAHEATCPMPKPRSHTNSSLFFLSDE